ncbi:MAG TPA: GNAT family N-acetyltransferase [Blastocatellia bacterium]|nr:GNAT family N-acetyltransferase [Blastocatellia bacterium]
MAVRITQTRADDSETLAGVLALLAQAGLPEEGVREHFGSFLIARDGPQLIGCAGLERYGETALLRSLAVASDRRGNGLGKELTVRMLELAKAAGVQEVVLLTTTARDFFERQAGFAVTGRGQYDQIFAQSAEWHLSRCSSAVCMYIRLNV